MSTEDPRALARRFYEVFNRGDLDKLDVFIPVDFVDHNAFPGQPPGLEGLKYGLSVFRGGFPDIKITNEDVLVAGDKVVVRSTARGTNTASFMGIPPTGKPIEIAAIDIWTVRGGKLVECWHVEELLQMMMQIGVVPAPGQTVGQ